MKRNNYISIFGWIYSRLSHRHRQALWWVLFSMIGIALFEAATLFVIAVFTSIVTDPEAIIASDHFKTFSHFFPELPKLSIKALIMCTGGIVLSMTLLKNFMKGIIAYRMSVFGAELERYFGSKLLFCFLKHPYHWHLDQNSSDLINAINWRRYLANGFFNPCLTIINNLLLILLMLGTLFYVQPMISSIVFIVLGSTAALIFILVKPRINRFASNVRDQQIAINREVLMAVQGIKDVKVTQTEKAFVQKFEAFATPLVRIMGMQGVYIQLPVLIMETIGFAMLIIAIYILLGVAEHSTALITGTMALLAVTAWRAIPGLSLILANLASINKSMPFITHLIKYFEMSERNDTAIHPATHNQSDPIMLKSEIKFTDVSYSYGCSSRDVIKNIDFIIRKGKSIGFIGKSGAGKSTIADLLIGLFYPEKGIISIDGEKLNDSLRLEWLKAIGYVDQFPYIYDGTIAENVAFGLPKNQIDKDKVLKSCMMASMSDFIQDLPNGIDTLIGERGVKLSGGQRQRIAIARALFKKPEVIIFDEATSSLDTKSEKLIQQTINSLKGSHTLVIIAHRLSTIMDCDELIWLEGGRVKMSGCPIKVLKEYQGEPNLN